jgi:hypothetical protein
MIPTLIDEGLPRVAPALRELELDVRAVGDAGAPPRGGSDRDNCSWCAENGAVLVTQDRGRKDRQIIDALAELHVHALFIYNDLRAAPAHHLAGALLVAESRIEREVQRRRHRLTPAGGLRKR